jgi:hypothetical protein
MEIEEKRRDRDEIYVRIFESRRRGKTRSGRKLARGTR